MTQQLRADLDVTSLYAPPEQALSAPGLLDRVITLGNGMPRYFLPGPTRQELRAAIEAPSA